MPDAPAWYVDFFSNAYLQVYGPALTEERTAREVAFIESALSLEPGNRVLDLCCGIGRHAMLLAQHGLDVVGQDLSEEYTAEATHRAHTMGLPNVHFIPRDMRDIPYDGHFDAVINMFTAFGYFESDEDNYAVLRAVHRALRPDGRFLLDTLNREWVIMNQIPQERHARPDGSVLIEKRSFNLETGRNHVEFAIEAGGGRSAAARSLGAHDIRLYTLAEMVRMLADAGFRFERAYGGFDAAPYEIGSRRMIVLARPSPPVL